MLIKPCIIIVDDRFYVDENLDLAKDIKKAFKFNGKRKTKKIVSFMKKHGVSKVKIKEL
jgi:hypothetical protein